MSDTRAAREAILKRLRESAPRAADRTRASAKPRGGPPPDTETLAKEFTDRAVLAGAVVARVSGAGKSGAEAVAFMKELGFSSALLSAERVVAESGMKESLAAAGFRVSSQGDDPALHRESSFASDVGVTGAFCGIAETGTVVLPMGDGYSRLIAHAPFAHVVLLPVRDIVADTHGFWSLVADKGVYTQKRVSDFGKPPAGTAKASGPRMKPPAFTFITGPSMTADIALTAVRGIHGPGKMLILLIG